MSYDLAVWEGVRPMDDAIAAETYERWMSFLEAGEPRPPSERIRAFVAALTSRWPDLTDLDDDHVDDSPWASGPLIAEASGSFIYFPMVWSRAEEASAFAAAIAAEHGLVCFDPQLERLRPGLPTATLRRGLIERWRRG